MKFELLTLTGVAYRGKVTEVAVSTQAGQLTILPHHEALTAIAKPGPVRLHTHGGEGELFAAFGGLLEVVPTEDGGLVRLLADEAEAATELVQAEVEAALARARELKAGAHGEHELTEAQQLVDRQEIRLEVAKLHRRYRGR
mgnify:CR=1 FL=1